MSGYRLSRQAELDVEDIEDYSARRWGDEKAAQYVRDIFGAFGKLAARPELGRPRTDIPPPYLVHAVGSHLIVYRINDGRVEVLNVLHPAMDIGKRIEAALKGLKGRRDG